MSDLLEIRSPSEQTEGTRSQVLRWMKAVGDAVQQNEPLLEIETDKVTVEVPAPASGVLESILKREQEEIEPGDLLGRIRVGDASAKEAGTAPVASAAPPRAAAEPGSRTDKLSPAVRKLIAGHGLDPHAIEGSGQGGRITIEDVQRHLSSADSIPARAASPGTPEPAASSPRTAGTRLVQHTAMRKRIAEHMVESLLRTAPHVTTIFEADLSQVLAHRSAQREDFARRGANLTLTAYFVAATVDAVRAVPEANSRWLAQGVEINESVHVGVATALGAQGLVVPVVRNAHTLDLFAIARTLDDLVTRAREQRLAPHEVQGGTITISNHGVSGSLIATPIVINQPQSAIVGVGKLEKRPVVVEEGGREQIVVRPRCYLTLTIDHRVMDGFQANRFLQVLIGRLERWDPGAG